MFFTAPRNAPNSELCNSKQIDPLYYQIYGYIIDTSGNAINPFEVELSMENFLYVGSLSKRNLANFYDTSVMG